MLRWSAARLSLAAVTAAMTTSIVAGADGRQTPFRAGTDVVAIYVSVADASGRLATHLDRDQFLVFDNGKPSPIVMFSDDEVPITMVLMLDVSGTMSREFDRVRAAATHVIDTLPAADRLRIGTFGDEVAVSPILTNDGAVLRRILAEEMWPSNTTTLWSGLRAAMDSLSGEKGRRVVLAITDGLDGCRCPSPPVVRQAVAGEFILYAVSIEGRPLTQDMTDIVATSGGAHFELPRTGDLNETFERIMFELHHQYSIGIKPAADGRTHKLEVRMRQPGLIARARKSYQAPKR